MDDKWCVCIWQKFIATYFDKEEKVNAVRLIINNTINQKEVSKQCNNTDIVKCLDSGNSIFGDYLAGFIERYGTPVEEKDEQVTKFSWEDNGFSLIMVWSPIGATIFVMKSR